jgi:hypothetical protein
VPEEEESVGMTPVPEIAGVDRAAAIVTVGGELADLNALTAVTTCPTMGMEPTTVFATAPTTGIRPTTWTAFFTPLTMSLKNPP